MEFLQAVEGRRSCRAFGPRPVAREHVIDLLRRAGRAPSALNLQPWEVTVVMGGELDRLRRRILRARAERTVACAPGATRPIPDLHQQRRRATFGPLAEILSREGVSMDHFVGEGSCRFYGAPAALILAMDRAYSRDRYLCLGAFVGYLLLSAQDMGLATCPIGLIAAYDDESREQLNLSEEKEVVLGLALGYADEASPLSAFPTPREPVEAFVRWYG